MMLPPKFFNLEEDIRRVQHKRHQPEPAQQPVVPAQCEKSCHIPSTQTGHVKWFSYGRGEGIIQGLDGQHYRYTVHGVTGRRLPTPNEFVQFIPYQVSNKAPMSATQVQSAYLASRHVKDPYPKYGPSSPLWLIIGVFGFIAFLVGLAG